MLRSLEQARRDGCSYVMYFRSVEKRPNNLGKSWGSNCARVYWGAIIVEPVDSHNQPHGSGSVSTAGGSSFDQSTTSAATLSPLGRAFDVSSDDIDGFHDTQLLVQEGDTSDRVPAPCARPYSQPGTTTPTSKQQRETASIGRFDSLGSLGTDGNRPVPKCKVTVAWHVDLAGWVHTTSAMHEQQVAELMVNNVDHLRQHLDSNPVADIAGIKELDARNIHSVVNALNAKSTKRVKGGSGLRATSKRLQTLVNTPVVAVGSHVTQGLHRISFKGGHAAATPTPTPNGTTSASGVHTTGSTVVNGKTDRGGGAAGATGDGGIATSSSQSKRRSSLSPAVAIVRAILPESESSRASKAASKKAAECLTRVPAKPVLDYKYDVPDNNVVLPEALSSDGKTSLWWDSGNDPNARKVRGPNYLTGDKVKVESGKSAMELLQMQWAFFDEPKAHISACPEELVQQQHVGRTDRPFMFVLNFMVPTIGNFVMYMAKRRDSPVNPTFERMLEEFMNGTDEFRNDKFKIIPSIIDGYFLVKRAVGNKPALLCKKIDTSYYKGDNYFEVCIDVGSSRMAKSLMGLVKSYAGSLSLDLAFLMESQTEDELPEIVLGAVRIVRPHMTARKARKAAAAAAAAAEAK
jgi:hypothetical protein